MPSPKPGGGGWVLPAALDRERAYLACPRCDVCRLPMSPVLHGLGQCTHPCCDRHETPSTAELAEAIRILNQQRGD